MIGREIWSVHPEEGRCEDRKSRVFFFGLVVITLALSTFSCAFIGSKGEVGLSQVGDRIVVKKNGANSGFLVKFSRSESLAANGSRRVKLVVANFGETKVSVSFVGMPPGRAGKGTRLNLKPGESGTLLSGPIAKLIASSGEIYIRGDLKRSINVELLLDWQEGAMPPEGLLYKVEELRPSF